MNEKDFNAQMRLVAECGYLEGVISYAIGRLEENDISRALSALRGAVYSAKEYAESREVACPSH